jgi:HAD superfamily hydrolase (TIGR01509 family)
MLTILKPQQKTPIRGILFDMDGVVIDSERLFTRFWMASAADLGFPMTRDQALQLRSLRREQGVEKMHAFFGPTANFDEIRAHRIELMEAHIAEYGVDEKPGIRALLAFLKEKGIPCAITSSSALPVIRERLGRLGILEDFTALCSGKDVPNGKPFPDIYLAGAAAIGVAPENCLAIEDSPTGLESAWRAGCMGVFVPDQDQPDEVTLSRAFAKADSLTDVMALIEK